MKKKKQKSKTHWNHRILTTLVKRSVILDHPKYDYRVFFVAEVYYNNDVPVSYGEEHNLLSNMESVKSIKWTLKHAKKALKKPVLDTDNWPNEWSETLT